MKPTRHHRVTLSLRFDKPVTRGEAVDLARSHIWGDFYPCPIDTKSGAGRFDIVGTRSTPRLKRNRR